MFDITWGELSVLTCVGFFLISRQDLPKAAHLVGMYTGRLVGFLQGATARAESFTADSHLKQLQNELRTGLRELDAVKSELAVSMSPSGMLSRNMGALTATVNRSKQTNTKLPTNNLLTGSSYASNPPSVLSTPNRFGSLNTSMPSNYISNDPSILVPPNTPDRLSSTTTLSTSMNAPSGVIMAALVEKEWENRGIGFVSQAEKRRTGMNGSESSNERGGSILLAQLLQQSLIHDQYDILLGEQESALYNRMQREQESVKTNVTTKPNS